MKNEDDIDKPVFINIEIVKIIFGQRMAKDDADFLKKLIGKFGSTIEILNFQEIKNKKSILSNTSNV
ncbi:MAG: hypothetical protein QG567_2202 [Campylobacterota bacterium]|nr:hypothetical protein [Campylobacterota bacterium]